MISEFIVAAGWENDTMIGTCKVERVRGNERISFEYDKNWLQQHPDLLLDPDLVQTTGPQYVTDKKCFGFLSDIAPDRWGRKLMERNEIEISKKEHRAPVNFMESDYILRVSDHTRQGGIRLFSKEGTVYSDNRPNDIPPISDIRKLESAALRLENNDQDVDRWIAQLIEPGSSLGGARPKANIIDTDGSIWIAKFPSKNDDINVGAWEMICHELAEMCGLSVPRAKLLSLSEHGDTFLVERFDRTGDKRHHFASAMTMLGETDGSDNTSSYLDLVDIVEKICKNSIENDLHELWRLMIFNICVGNTDDHLRNHGFVLKDNEWHLSPVYDVNPSADKQFLSLTIDGKDCSKSLDTAMSVYEYFRISKETAMSDIARIKDTVMSYRNVLESKYHISQNEIRRVKDAFSAADGILPTCMQHREYHKENPHIKM